MGYQRPKPLQKLLHKGSLQLYTLLVLGSLFLLALILLLSVPRLNSLPTVSFEVVLPSFATTWMGNDIADAVDNSGMAVAVVEESKIVPFASNRSFVHGQGKDEGDVQDQEFETKDGSSEAVMPSCKGKSVSCTNGTGAHDGRRGVVPVKKVMEKKREPVCNSSYTRTVVCDMEGEVRIHGKSGTIHFLTTTATSTKPWRVKPYARKEDPRAMSHVRGLAVTELPSSRLRCDVNHTVPAVVFSTGGYLGNIFHDYVDVLVPLFITSRLFRREVQFFVTNRNVLWIQKYRRILDGLTRYDILDLDSEERVHCLPRATVGLRRHNAREFSIDPSPPPGGPSLLDFGAFVRSAFSLPRSTVETSTSRRPRLLIISRRSTRKFENLREIAGAARRVGFEVVVGEGSSPDEFAGVVNSCDAMLGVHGAGVTNMVFLPERAVVVQVVPLGGMLWWTRGCFGEPAEEMGLRYLEYEIGAEESSLAAEYPRDSVVFRDPEEITRKEGWYGWGKVYLEHQNVSLNVTRFLVVLHRAMELLRHTD